MTSKGQKKNTHDANRLCDFKSISSIVLIGYSCTKTLMKDLQDSDVLKERLASVQVNNNVGSGGGLGTRL